MKNRKGFTLVELLAVVAIMAILVIVAVPNVMKLFKNAKRNSFEVEVKNIYKEAKSKFIVNNGFSRKETVYCNANNCKGTKLDLSGGGNINYSIKLDKAGRVVCFQASNGTYTYASQGIVSDATEITDIIEIDELNPDIKPDCTYFVDYHEVQRINLLNLYPDGTTGRYKVQTVPGNYDSCNSYKYYSSTSIKKWMEEPSAEAPEGYGKGIIKVIPVSYTEFNSNPNPDYWVKRYYDMNCLSDTYPDGSVVSSTKADVIYVGVWDANGNSAYSQAAIDALVDWTRKGKPIITGHDVLIYSEVQSKPLALALQGLFGIDIHGGNSTFSNKVHILSEKENNIFTQWPWTIENRGENGVDGLTIPTTHCTGQYVLKGDVWISLGEPIITEDQAKQNNFYLETYNNTAMIQTGHSNAQATEDEQKIVANTIFYMYYKFVLKKYGN